MKGMDMVNEEKVRMMNHLALYEKREGKKYLPISRYYRSDYIGLALIRNFFLVTIGFLLTGGAVLVYFGEYLLENIYEMDLFALGTRVVLAYAAVLVAYSVLTYLVYAIRYHRAKKSVRGYYQELTKLEKFYGREEKKAASRRNSRRV